MQDNVKNDTWIDILLSSCFVSSLSTVAALLLGWLRFRVGQVIVYSFEIEVM